MPTVPLKRAIEVWLEESVAGRKAEDATKSHANAVLALVENESVAQLAEVAERVRRSTKDVEEGEPPAPFSPATINRRLCVLKAVAKFAWRRKGWTPENLSPRIELMPERKYQRRDVTPDMAAALIANASTARAKALIAFSAYTGLRLGEVLKLTPANVRGDVLVILDTKNGSDRMVPIVPRLQPHLKQLPFGSNWRNIYRGFERAREKAGLTIRYHDLRHMVGTALHEAGADQRRIMDILGHKSVQTSARYIHPSTAANRKALVAAVGGIGASTRKRTKKAA